MANWNQIRLTRQGLHLQAKVQAGICKLQITRIATGDGEIDDPEKLIGLTQLLHYQQSFDINDIKKEEGSSIATIEAIIDNRTVTTGYFLREIGIYAIDPTGGEILYAVANKGEYADFIPESVQEYVRIVLNLKVVVGNAENVIIEIDEDMVFVTKAEFKRAVGTGWRNENVKKNAEDIQRLAIEVAVLKNAALNNISSNIFVVNFSTFSESEEFIGIWNKANARLEV